MKGSLKANIFIYLIIATIAFTISSASNILTIPESKEPYKLISIENDSFEPNLIHKVPTIIAKNHTNSTNSTQKNMTKTTTHNTTKINKTDNKKEEKLKNE